MGRVICLKKCEALGYIDSKKDIFVNANDCIWEYAETAFKEYKSAELLCEELEKEGFEVQRGVADIETAFLGKFGSGKPVIGVLGEFDALSGLSQVAGGTSKEPIEAGAAGHGCGHNCLGVGSLAAAFAVKKYLEENNKSGTIIYYGTPGEEGGSGKAFMARDGVFDELDAAITWHPQGTNQVFTGSSLANAQIAYKFKGVSAHAAGAPHLGRSALDAVELMNVGVQFLREHMVDSARVHYAITDTGGYSPNVVQPKAEVLYLIRSQRNDQVEELVERVHDIARGAALMTGTTMEIDFMKACSNTIPSTVLEKVLYKNFEEIGVDAYTAEEEAYAKKMVESYENPTSDPPAQLKVMSPEGYDMLKEKMAEGKVLNDFLMPFASSDATMAGSTDVGDVSWVCPTAQINVVTAPSAVPGHSWQFTSSNKTSIAHKGVVKAGKVMAAAIIDMIEDPSIIEEAKAEHKKKTGGPYKCPIPKGVKPRAIGSKN